MDNQLKIELAFGMGSGFEEDVSDPEATAVCMQGFIERASAILNMWGSITGVGGTQIMFLRQTDTSTYH